MPQEPDRCPLCHQPNRCAIAGGVAGEVQCWCMSQSFPDLAKPAVAKALAGHSGAGCLCQACVQRLVALR